MNRIITAAFLRDRLSLQDDDGVNAAIESAIGAALVHVESVLNTSLEVGVRSDVFFIDPGRSDAIDGLYLLRLSSGFLKTAPAAQIFYGSTLTSVLASGDASGATGLTTYLLNAEKGFLKVPDYLSGCYVKVDYTSGFSEEDAPPEWLKEAVLTYAVKALSSQQVSDGKPELSNVFAFLDSHTGVILDRKLRTSSAAILPLV